MRDAPTSADLLWVALRFDIDSWERWDCVSPLHKIDDAAAFDGAVALCASDGSDRRILGVDVIAQLGAGNEEQPHRTAAGDLLLRLLEDEHDPGVLESIAFGLGHLREPRAVAPLCALARHPDANVRYAVVHGLSMREDEAALAALIALSTDASDDVRDWATFGLGTRVSAEFPALREALAARLDDHDRDTREEAIEGLATRGDPRAVAPLLRAMGTSEGGAVYLDTSLLELAAATGDERLRAQVEFAWRAVSPPEAAEFWPGRFEYDIALLAAAPRYGCPGAAAWTPPR